MDYAAKAATSSERDLILRLATTEVKYMILPAPEGIGINISCILTHWLLPEVTWRSCDPMSSAEDYGQGNTGVDFCYVEAALVADPNCYLD